MAAKKGSNIPKIVISGQKGMAKTSNALADHEYVMEVSHVDHTEKRKDLSSLQNTPTKTSAKKQKNDESPEVSNATLMEILVARFYLQDGKLSSIERKITENSLLIVSLTKAVEFNAAEIKDCKAKINLFDKQLNSVTTSHADLINRTSELERYKRRWNLRIIGMKEVDGEDIRREVISLLAEIAPHLHHKLEEIVDTVHRIGPKMKDNSRQVIIQFCMRKYRDEFWRSSKGSDVCKRKGVKFTKDLSKEDREARAALWPRISEARAAGKKAYYRGPYGYIEGTRIIKEG
ncbi:uncharacterized protein si:ch211-196c10.15 [Hypomesus transpacificus]|uniref:uncharacterized protein si:ch211-196c10.15 n=1 Tax=Hypomesus transpacificus TaxID=137520 RepID=UPI001F07ACD8|nr:uncharacterized protein si:ch211-196c10.15 [Hypomesus transpacificus]XP_046907206.1 uncharacterized protein si:ch211-196c10.15 [Hypomesus transpacificus]